jgi:hypothetical protein
VSIAKAAGTVKIETLRALRDLHGLRGSRAVITNNALIVLNARVAAPSAFSATSV